MIIFENIVKALIRALIVNIALEKRWLESFLLGPGNFSEPNY